MRIYWRTLGGKRVVDISQEFGNFRIFDNLFDFVADKVRRSFVGLGACQDVAIKCAKLKAALLPFFFIVLDALSLGHVERGFIFDIKPMTIVLLVMILRISSACSFAYFLNSGVNGALRAGKL